MKLKSEQRKQIGLRLPVRIIQMMRDDSRRFNRTIEEIAGLMARRFYIDTPKLLRQMEIQMLPRKVRGRKVME